MTALRASASGVRSRLLNWLFAPLRIGRLVFPTPIVIALATIGFMFLTVVATTTWATPSDEHAYWLAGQRLLEGQPLYALSVPVGTPYAYWYPPPLAQVLAPITGVLDAMAFTWAWTILLLACLLFLADRRIMVALALAAFLPVTIELSYRNVHLVLAVLVVLALRRHPIWWAVAASIKGTPAIGVLYLVAARRYRDAALVLAAGLAILLLSVLLSPAGWAQFATLVQIEGSSTGASIVAVPFPLRLATAALLALIAGRLGGRRGEALLVVALVVGNPTLWATAFSLLVAIVPLWHRPGAIAAGSATAGSASGGAATGGSATEAGEPVGANP